MEGVPRIPMLSFPLRRNADNPSFRSKLSKFISLHYGEDGESYRNEFHELESLRHSAVHATKDYSGLSLLKKYYCQLEFLKSRFPLEEGSPVALSFSWADPYTEQVHTWSDIRFEISSILYNIGAMHTQIAGNDPRTTVDDMKNCVTHYQCAAWAFETIQKKYIHFVTADLNISTLWMMSGISLVQAQECVLEKSLIDNRRSVITAKLLLQIVDYYKANLKNANEVITNNTDHGLPDKVIKPLKNWKKLMDLKISYYSSLVNYFRGQEADDQKLYGQRLAFFRAAKEGIESTVKMAKNFDKGDGIHDTLGFVCDVIIGKCVNAEKENELIYHEKVPSIDSIDAIKGVSLVKPIPLKVDDPEVSGKDIFGRLVPIEAHATSSLYSEEKAQLLRNTTAKINEKNQILENFMAALQLDQLDLHSTQNQIDQKLVDCCAYMNGNGEVALKKLVDLMTDLSGKYLDVEETLGQIKEILKSQELKEAEYCSLIGKRPPCTVLVDLRHEADKYADAQAKASASNEALRELVQSNITNLKILMQPLSSLISKIPTVAINDPKELSVVEEMKKLNGKVQEMIKQREVLERDLRDAIQKDDITGKIVTANPKDLEALFKIEITKHKKMIDILDQNLLAQDNILRALTETNARYAETREKVVRQSEERKRFVGELLKSYDGYEQLKSNCEAAIKFYAKFKENTNKLLSKLKGVAKVQDEEREGKLAGIRPPTQSSLPHPTTTPISNQPKLKDYLANRNNTPVTQDYQPKLHQINPTSQPQNYSNPTNAMYPTGGGSAYNPQLHATPTSYTPPSPVQQAYNQPPPSMTYRESTPPQQLPQHQYPPPPSNYGNYNQQSYNPPPSQNSYSAPHSQQINPYNNPPPRLQMNQYNPPAPPPQPQTNNSYNPNHFSNSGPPYMNSTSLNTPTYSTAIQPSQNQPQTASYKDSPAIQSTFSTQQDKYPAVIPSSNYGNYDPRTINTPQLQQMNSYNTNQPQIHAYSQHSNNPGPSSYSSQPPPPNTPSYPAPPPAMQSFNQPQQPSYKDSPPLQSPYSTQQNKYPAIIQPANYGSYNMNSFNPPPSQINSYYSYNNIQQPTDVSYSQQPMQVSSSNHQLQTLYVSNNTSQESVPTNQSSVEIQPVTNIDLLADIDMNPPNIHPPLQPMQKQNEERRVESEFDEEGMELEISDGDYLEKPTMIEKKNSDMMNPLEDPVYLDRLIVEMDRLINLIDSFDTHSLNGPTNLDMKWREVLDLTNADSSRRSISIARCYPMKNRVPDILPFDQNRVRIPTRDDYINASYISKLGPNSLPLIVTQLPMQSTLGDFWTMIWSEGVQLIISFLSDTEMDGNLYYPTTRNQDLNYSQFIINLQTTTTPNPNFMLRIFCIKEASSANNSRVVLHVQYKDWGGGVFPKSTESFIGFIQEVHGLYDTLRDKKKPVVIHCKAGVGRSGLFAILSTAIREILNRNTGFDLAQLTGIASGKRKGILIDREYLRYAYHALLVFFRQITIRKTNIIGSEEKSKSKHERKPSQEIYGGPFYNLLPPLTEMKVKDGEEQESSAPVVVVKEDEGNVLKRKNVSSFTDLPPSLTSLEPASFKRKESISELKHKKNEDFESGKGALLNRKEKETTNDPLNSLDPLWTLH